MSREHALLEAGIPCFHPAHQIQNHGVVAIQTILQFIEGSGTSFPQSNLEFLELMRLCRDARNQCQIARAALEDHISDHRC
jgi:hypothetical protein